MSQAGYRVAGEDLGKDAMRVVARDRSGTEALNPVFTRARALGLSHEPSPLSPKP